MRFLIAGSLPTALALAFAPTSAATVVLLACALTLPGLLLLLSFPVAARQNWARIAAMICASLVLLFAGFLAISVVLAAARPSGETPAVLIWLTITAALSSLQGAGALATVCLLGSKSSRQWFWERSDP